ncbi:SDR family NAD(P)-dependent oxidoreductase [Rhabdobacter roseus]|uniref:Short-subunit dehydrogenase n=1 Tax=Rhabdobacter roseus TaxID=1655419 RepID=A0A840TK69_9BACT|nr:SDR family oxidoreductase [Rhabdobacter roseus]MBB5283831.1 short-subunit dehydrogenase [Rhabdobacter roseus]
MKSFSNKVVWITGASSGIGEALALEFAREGARLVLSARRREELERVKQSVGLPEDQVLVLPMDVTQFDQAEVHAARVVGYFGRIDLIVHNAGISQRSYVRDTDFEVYRRLMDVDFFSTVALTQAVLPSMLKQQSGHFVVISSVAGKVGTPMRSGYNAAKHALHGFYDSLRAETHDDHIRVTVVCPGYIKTNVSVNALNAQGEQYGKKDANQEKGMSAQECARQIVEAVKKDKKEVYIGGLKETAAIYLRRFFPSLLFTAVRKNAPE